MNSSRLKRRNPKRKLGSSQNLSSSRRDADQFGPINKMVNQHGQALLNVNNTLHLQRLVGNRTVAKLISARAEGAPTIQRADELAGASRTALINRLEREVEGWHKEEKPPKFNFPKIVEDFKKTGKLVLISFAAVVNPEKLYFSRKGKLASLKRGQKISVLGIKLGWCRVKTDDGKLGWLRSHHLIPRYGSLDVMSTSGYRPAGGSGHSRDEIIIGGRG